MPKIVIGDFSDPTTIRDIPDNEVSLYDKGFVFDKSCEEELRAVVVERARLKKVYDDSFSLVLQAINKITREGRR